MERPCYQFLAVILHTSSALFSCRFNNLTERFFKNSPWPEAEIVAPVVQNGMCMYMYTIVYFSQKHCDMNSSINLSDIILI